MKKLLLLLLVFQSFVIFSEGVGINLTPLGKDLTTLFSGIGQDVIPLLSQNSISGDLYGEAEIDEVFFPFYLSIPSVSIATTDGIATVLSDENQEWKFITKLPSLVDSALTDDTREYYDITQKLFALPSVKLGFGFKLPAGYELHFSGMYLPFDDLKGLLPEEASVLSLSIVDVGVKIRKTIFSDQWLRPAFSIGVHYFYSQFDFGADFKLTDFVEEGVDVSGQALDLDGDFSINTKVQSFGLDFHLSKRLFIFTPFVKLSPTVYYSSMRSVGDFKATLSEEATEGEEVVPGDPIQLDIKESYIEGNGLTLFASAGLEIRLFFIALHLSISADLQNPTFEMGNATSLDFEETAFDKIALNLGFRIHF